MAGVGIAVGVSAAVNTISETIESLIDASSVTASGGIALNADSTATIRVLTVAGAAAGGVGGQGVGGAFAGAAAGSLNDIHETVEAIVSNTKAVKGGGAILLHAADGSTIDAAAGGVRLSVAGGAGAGGAASVGAGVALNTITDTVEAGLVNATVEADGTTPTAGLELQALSTSHILAVTTAGAAATAGGAGGGLAGSLAGAGSVNTIHDTIQALVSNSTVVTKNGGVLLGAEDDSTIRATAGAAAAAGAVGGVGGAAAAGASFASNTIGNTVLASIDGSTVNASGGVELDALSNATIAVLTVGIWAAWRLARRRASRLAGAGSGSEGNSIANTIEALFIHGSKVASGGVVALTALDHSSIDAAAGSLTLSGEGGGVGAASWPSASPSRSTTSATPSSRSSTARPSPRPATST